MVTLDDLQNVRLLTGEVRGSAGQWVAARNQFTQYFRARTPPDNTLTPPRNLARRAWGNSVQSWYRALTQTQRDGWHTYAAVRERHSTPNRRTRPTGQNEFVRTNALRFLAGKQPLRDAPTTYTLPNFTSPAVSLPFVFGTGTFGRATINTNDAWYTNTGAVLLGFASPPKTNAVNFYRSPVRLRFEFNPGDPPTQDYFVGSGGLIDPHYFVRWRLVTSDGRVSTARWATNF